MAKDVETEVDINMTPMIDMVFLLVIFFIIVNDMTQKELEDLKLPIALTAGHDEPPKGRPILNVMEDGKIVWRQEDLYWEGIAPKGIDPIRKGRPDYYWKLAETMAQEFVPHMKTKLDPVLKIDLPDDPILIRADRNTPFKHVQRIMEVCTRLNIKIWKVQLAASEPEKNQ